MIKINTLIGYEDVKEYYYIYRDGNKAYIYNKHINTILKPFIKKNKGNGYLYIKLCQNNYNPLNIRINRIIAIAYIPIPDNCNIDLLQVHHKDGNKTNNDIDNLEWVTARENLDLYSGKKLPGQITFKEYNDSKILDKIKLKKHKRFDQVNIIEWKNKC